MSEFVRNDAEPRRQALRDQEILNGIDYVEIGSDPRSITVVFFHEPPENLMPENVRITGGVRVRDPAVREVRVVEQPSRSQEQPDRETMDLSRAVLVVLARRGDTSAYRLEIVGLDGFDPRYRGIDFTFEGLDQQLDCATAPPAPPHAPPAPMLDYLAKDYAGFRRLAFDRLAQTIPGWTETHVPDIGVTLVEMMAYVGDQLSYQQDAVATEAYLATSRLRTSVRRHARLIDYIMHEGCNARAWVHVATQADVTMKAGELGFAVGDDPPLAEFWPVDDMKLSLFSSHNTIEFHAWGDGDCCLPVGATSATLRDAWIDPAHPERRRLDGLAPGMALLIEAVPAPGSRNRVDPSQRHVVRLRSVQRGADPIYGDLVVEVAWAGEDALPFTVPLPPAGKGPAPDIVAVARGNMVLADHGRRVTGETLAIRRPLPNTGLAAFAPGPRRPRLRYPGLTFRQKPDADGPASRAVQQDPRLAAPQVLSLEGPADPALGLGPDVPIEWTLRGDLVESGAEDAHAVVEMDDDAMAVLRFGDGLRGVRPGLAPFSVTYRVGNGPEGNVGAETITRVVFAGKRVVDGLEARNPLPATGGRLAEPVADVKRLAPSVFRSRRERAVTATDYARAAEEVFGVRRAAADIRQMGAMRLVQVSILPAHSSDPTPELLARVAAHLAPRRRIGHDVQVSPARTVALDVALTVGVQDDYLRGHVLKALREVLGHGIRPDGQPGFFHPDRMSFATPVHGSRIVAAAQATTGVQWVRLTRLRRLQDAQPDDWVQVSRAAVSLILEPLEVARMDNDPEHPERGWLTIDLRGGR